MKALEQIDFEDRLTIEYPVERKDKKAKKGIERANLFYYLHLSPFARLSVSEMYLFQYLQSNSGTKNEKEIMKIYLNYIPIKEEEKITEKTYLSAIAGTYPIRKIFEVMKEIPKEPGSRINEAREEEEEPRLPSPDSTPVAGAKTPTEIVVKPFACLKTPQNQQQQHDTIELDEEKFQGHDPLNESETNEIRQIDNALAVFSKNFTETSGSIIKPKIDTVDSILNRTEELVSALRVPGQGVYMRKESEKRINENLLQLLGLIEKTDKTQFISVHTLIRISEISKKYLDGPNQAKLLAVILREYRKVQERKVNDLRVEKKNVETTEQFDKQYKMLKELVQLFPENNSSQIRSATPKPEAKKVKTQQPKMKRNSIKQPPKQKTQEKPVHRPWNIKRGGTRKSTKGKSGGSSKHKPVKTDEEDSWIGKKSVELEDDALWEKISGPQWETYAQNYIAYEQPIDLGNVWLKLRICIVRRKLQN
eukprot:TRINITY_DN3728_c0_g1_i1.p1 TRINITY_DN3728_c0_g1~~TRINITY_DN3728_c0_g1_i1.p1  ORF type:complete len:478 (+),score=72.15 TRINITY_DN3728_c0_g1_i1:1028-2461(+)